MESGTRETNTPVRRWRAGLVVSQSETEKDRRERDERRGAHESEGKRHHAAPE